MRKNRSSFFNETMDYYNTQMPGMVGPNNMMPNATQYSMSQSGFYMGNQPQNNGLPYEDVNARLAKIERHLNKLEHRVNTLEQNNTSYSTEDGDTTINNMYMV